MVREVSHGAGKIRWGILGTGNIAKKFADGLKVLDGAALVAVGSRKQETADQFGDRYNIPRRHASYEALASDAGVDAIYVSTPHALHKANAILCLEHGKAVLCEKPFTINAREARQVVEAARKRRLFLMEAMWTRFLPLYIEVRQLLKEGVIGELRMVQADFGFRADFKPESRLFNPELGGGGLLDVGVYTVSLASMIFGGPPRRIASLADLCGTGVDEQAGMLLGYGDGEMAVLTCAVRTTTHHEALIIGTKGMIRVHHPFWHGTTLTLSVGGSEDRQVTCPYVGNGYNCEAAEVMRCLRTGKLESEVMPLDETITVMETMDRIREQWGLKYPME